MRHLLTALVLTLSATLLSAQTASTANVPPRTSAPTSALLEYRAWAATSDLPTFVVNTTPNEPGIKVDMNLASLAVTGGSTNARVTWLPPPAPPPGSLPTTTSLL